MTANRASFDVEALVKMVQAQLEPLANAEDATAMQAYMRAHLDSSMPFYGIKKPARLPTMKLMHKAFKPATLSEYKAAVRALWSLPHREEKYLALHYADRYSVFHVPEAMGLFEMLIREGQWWDLVDVVASNLVGGAFRSDRRTLKPIMLRWNSDDNLWIRRASVLSQLRHKAETDERLLFRLCLARASETEFFMRKAVGWALREYAKTAPQAVKKFVRQHRQALSGLSVREAAKQLKRTGRWSEA